MRTSSMAKKGSIMNIMVILLMVAALTYFLLNNLEDKREGQFKTIGTKQLKLINYYNKMELRLVFYDKIGMFMLPRALYRLGSSGGFYGISPCGTVGNYNLWSYKDEECRPDYRKSIGMHLQDAFNLYYSSMPEDTKPENSRFLFYTRGSSSVIVDAIAVDDITIKEDPEEGGMISYSAKPSFKMYAPYEISGYDMLYQKSVDMKQQCINKKDYQACVEESLVHMNAETPNIDWSGECNKGKELVFYTFLEKYQNCINTLGDDCICSFSMDFRGNKDAGVDGLYSIKLYSNGTIAMDRMKAYLKDSMKNDLGIYFGSSPMVMENMGYIMYFVRYNKDGSIEDQKIAKDSERYNSARDYETIMIYKDFVNEYNPENHFSIVEKNSGEIKCRIYPRNAKICATDKTNMYMFYDEESVVNENIAVKFAMQFNDIFPPAPIVGLHVEDKPHDENSVIISFNRSKDDDIYQYKLFKSDENFTNVDGMTPIETIYDDGLSSEINRLEHNVEEDNKDYYFAFTTVDVFGNENTSIVTVKGKSIDDLAPESSEVSFVGVSDGLSSENLEIVDLTTGAVWGDEDIKGFFRTKEETTQYGSYSKFSGSADLLTLPIDCSGYGLPNQKYIDVYEQNDAWGSAGVKLREATELYALQYRIHPALIAAHATKESGMGTNNKCTTEAHKSALTGCSWPESGCATGCKVASNCDSDMSQIRCTANVDRRAYEAASGGRGYSVYAKCSKYKGDEEKIWNCVLCTYQGGFKDEQQCTYSSEMKKMYCEWYNYYSQVGS